MVIISTWQAYNVNIEYAIQEKIKIQTLSTIKKKTPQSLTV